MRSSDGCSEYEEELFDGFSEYEEGLFYILDDILMSSESMFSYGQLLFHQVSFKSLFHFSIRMLQFTRQLCC